MADQTRPMAMDPPHITEFASERYFEKLNAQRQQQHQTQHHHQPTQESCEASTSSGSKFILPLRESKSGDVDTVKPDPKLHKSRFSSIRHRVFQSRSSHAESSGHTSQPRTSTEATRKSATFDQSFLALPNEMQVQILSSLPLTDVLNLRLASKSWHSLITMNETPIARYHVENHIPAYALRPYPLTDQSQLNLHYVCGIWHRLHVAAKLAYLMCEWITKDIFLRQTESQRIAFAPQHERMRRRLIPLLFTIFHFFETYRKLTLKYMAENGGKAPERVPHGLNPIEAEIMQMYDDQTLLRVHEVFPLVMSSFCRRLRPPTYVGRVERSLRGYMREKPSDDVHVAILCIGGLREVERLWEIKGYNSRRSAVDVWYNALTKEQPPPEAASTKSRRGLMSFGRKKSTSGDVPRTSTDGLSRVKSSGSIDGNMGFDFGLLNASLTAGVPMPSLNSQQARQFLGDLPVLQEIWTITAETLIMRREIVSRLQDIKRNQQVMLDLIREDGMDEEDEWWYSRSIPDSVRPSAASVVDDDAD